MRARGADTQHAEEALEKLCCTYWPPIYAYIRRDGYRAEDAQDLTQEFLSRLVHKEWLTRLQHRNGKFRSFLLTFLKHFLSDQRDRDRALKRGGGAKLIQIDDFGSKHALSGELASQLTPEEVFDKRWAETIVHHANERLRAEYVASGNLPLFELLKDLAPGERGERTYVEVGARFGMSEGAVKSAVFRFRQRRAAVYRDEIAQTVHPEGLDEEIRYLLSIIGK
jgi:RNA polymerase sigma-70 factor (ECF subfamily)